MAMEQAIERLAYAIERQGEGAAVEEIIRQRDEALRDLEDMTRQRDGWMDDAEAHLQSVVAGDRRIRSLKGVITRMKKAAK